MVAECYHKKLQSLPEQIVKAINGRLTPHFTFLLKSMQKHIQSVENQIAEVDAEIGNHIKDFEKEIELLKTIPAVGKEGAIGIVAEIGVDMSVFPSEHHLASHSGMCPSNNESTGKKKSSKTRQRNKHLKATLTELAWGATRTKKSFYKAKYGSLVVCCGKKRVLLAIGRILLNCGAKSISYFCTMAFSRDKEVLIQKWKPEIFKRHPLMLKNKILHLQL